VKGRWSTATDNAFKVKAGLIEAFQFVLRLSQKSILYLEN
jgi:hypothetical protein